jgi:hypothetical protein
MANARLVHTIASDDAVLALTTGATASGYNIALTNMQSTLRDAIWRSTTATTQVIKGDWAGEDRKIGFVGLFRHLNHGGSIRTQLFSDQAATVQVFDSGTVAIASSIAIGSLVWGAVNSTNAANTDLLYYAQPYGLFFTMTTCKSFKVTLTGTPSNGNGYYQVSRLALGPWLEFGVNPDLGMALTWLNNDVRIRTTGGSQLTTFGRRWRRLEFDLNYLGDNDRRALLDLLAYAGNSRDMVVSVFPGAGGRDERDYMLNGRFADTNPLVWQNFSYRSKKLSFEES